MIIRTIILEIQNLSMKGGIFMGKFKVREFEAEVKKGIEQKNYTPPWMEYELESGDVKCDEEGHPDISQTIDWFVESVMDAMNSTDEKLIKEILGGVRTQIKIGKNAIRNPNCKSIRLLLESKKGSLYVRPEWEPMINGQYYKEKQCMCKATGRVTLQELERDLIDAIHAGDKNEILALRNEVIERGGNPYYELEPPAKKKREN